MWGQPPRLSGKAKQAPRTLKDLKLDCPSFTVILSAVASAGERKSKNPVHQ